MNIFFQLWKQVSVVCVEKHLMVQILLVPQQNLQLAYLANCGKSYGFCGDISILLNGTYTINNDHHG